MNEFGPPPADPTSDRARRSAETAPLAESEEGPIEGSSRQAGLLRPLLLLLILVALIVVARSLDLGRHLGNLQQWIDGLGWLGPIVFIPIYAVAVVAAIPGSAMTVIAGAIFGATTGVIVVSIAATLGAALSFLIARYVAREPIARRLSSRAAFRRLDDLTERHGATIVALTRLVPIFPFNLLNYGFGLTRVRFWTYVFWSWLCMLPGTVLYVVGADAVTKAVSRGEVPWHLVAAAGVTAVALWILVRLARSKLRQKEKESHGNEGATFPE
jgi:uncharacterized membrane protein YdjX (TVP38/TMEM64 family)